MNRSSNVFNTAPLGSGGASGFIFLAATQVCQVTYGAILNVGRMLRASVSPEVQSTAKLTAGRMLKSTVQAQANVVGVLRRYAAVYLSAVCDASATTTAALTKWHQKFLSSTVDAIASVTGNVRKIQKVSLAAVENAEALFTVKLTKLTQVFLAGTTTATAVVSGMLRKGIRLSASVDVVCSTEAVLNESSRTRAAAERISYIQPDGRVAVVPKGI